MGIWRNGNASDFGSEDCRFDPCYARLFVIFFYYYCTHSSLSLFLSLNGNVAQSVERKSHNLKVVSSILTVPTFFTFFPRRAPLCILILLRQRDCCYSILAPFRVTILFSFITYFLYGHMAQWKRIRLRI